MRPIHHRSVDIVSERNHGENVRCKDVGMDCDFVAHADTEQEILQQVAAHAQTTYGMHDIPAEVVAKVRSVIYEG